MDTSTNLPIIDLQPFLNTNKRGAVTEEQKEIAQEIHKACTEFGFFYVKNHGVDTKLINTMMESTKDLFNLSTSQKAALSSKNSPLFRGYISTIDALHTCNSKKKEEAGLDQKESFTIGAESKVGISVEEGENKSEGSPKTSPMHGPNQWPNESDLPKFKPIMEEYWNAQINLCRVIAQGLALSLELPASFFDEHLTDPVAQMVLLKYPPPPSKSMDGEACQMKHTGCGEHTDCGFLTILTQDLPGLEVQDPQTNEWKPVKPLEDTFVVNLGDMTARWTNDRYKSTKHRVYNRNEYTRYSVPFFCNCNFEAPVKCIINGGGEIHKRSVAEGAKYDDTTAGAYILERLGLMRDLKN